MTPLAEPRFTLATTLKAVLILGLIIFICAYVLYQARNFILGPSIALSAELSPVQSERIIEITGTAKNIVAITLNGREIHTDERGVFHEELVLESGYTVMTLRAQDRFGRETTLTREFVLKLENSGN